MRKSIKIGAVGLLGMVGLVSCVGGSSTPQDKVESGNTKKKQVQQVEKVEKVEKLEVVSDEVIKDEYTQYISGVIKNNASKDYTYVQVEINLLDEDGNIVGSTLANVNNLEAGKTWKFKAIVLDENYATYEIKDVTGM